MEMFFKSRRPTRSTRHRRKVKLEGLKTIVIVDSIGDRVVQVFSPQVHSSDEVHILEHGNICYRYNAVSELPTTGPKMILTVAAFPL